MERAIFYQHNHILPATLPSGHSGLQVCVEEVLDVCIRRRDGRRYGRKSREAGGKAMASSYTLLFVQPLKLSVSLVQTEKCVWQHLV